MPTVTIIEQVQPDLETIEVDIKASGELVDWQKDALSVYLSRQVDELEEAITSLPYRPAIKAKEETARVSLQDKGDSRRSLKINGRLSRRMADMTWYIIEEYFVLKEANR